jgi:hypothetical protein
MAVQPVSIETTFNAMRERAVRLEHEAAALRSDLDEMSIQVMWQTQHAVTSEALQRVSVSDDDLATYQRHYSAPLSRPVLRLVLQAHTAATRLKLALPTAERSAAIDAVRGALEQAAAQAGLVIPEELEAMIGD